MYSLRKYIPIGSNRIGRRFGFWSSHFIRFEIPFLMGIPLSLFLFYIDLEFSISLSICLVFIGLCFGLQLLENTIVYATSEHASTRLLFDDPVKFGIPYWEWIKLISPDRGCLSNEKVELSGLFILQPNKNERLKCPVILLFHGNAGNVTSQLYTCKILLTRMACNILILDYRGYGKSTGQPTENGFYQDSICALNYLSTRSDINNDKIFVFGQSLGGALAMYLASNSKCSCKLRGVIMENTFTSIPDLASHLFNLPLCIWSRILLNNYPTLDRLSYFLHNINDSVRVPPMLFISGDLDTLIPPKMMWKLSKVYDKIGLSRQTSSHTNGINNSDGDSHVNAHDPATFVLCGRDGLVRFSKGDHNDTWLSDHWCDVIARFINQSLLNVPNSTHKLDLIV